MIMAPFKYIRNIGGMSERELAEKCQISRLTLRAIEANGGNPTIDSLNAVAASLDRKIELLLVPEECSSSYSTIAISLKTVSDGFESWKIHFLEFVDEFRRTADPRLLLLPPIEKLDFKLTALVASIVVELCREVDMPAPAWARKRYFLREPWFVSGIENLKATCLVESPLAFRINNIFVQRNFLSRA